MLQLLFLQTEFTKLRAQLDLSHFKSNHDPTHSVFILYCSVSRPVGEARRIPSKVTLNKEELCYRHTVNNPLHLIASQPTTTGFQCTWLLKLLRKKHVMSCDDKGENLDVLIDSNWKGCLCAHCMHIFLNPTPIKAFQWSAHKLQVCKNRCLILKKSYQISVITETRQRSTPRAHIENFEG
jgi:hypothetical protein